MGFDIGNKLGKGRPKGSPNRTTAQVKEYLASISEKLEETLFSDLQELTASERIKIWLSLQEYLVPKLSRQELSTGKEDQAFSFEIVVIGKDEPILTETE